MQIINWIAQSYVRFAYIKRMNVGKNVTYSNGFRVYHGAEYVKVGDNVNLSDLLINAGVNARVIIENNVFFGHRCMLLARSHDYKSLHPQNAITGAPITIKKGAWVASGAILLPGVIIGENAVIAAGSVVTKSVPRNTISGGIPNKTIGTYSKNKQ